MGAVLQIICLAGHGETARSLSGQHTGLTDLLLTEHGELNAQSLGRRLRGFAFTKVLTSPLRHAVRTCELAGFGTEVEADRNLLEWNYVQYEGRTTKEIREQRPSRQLFRDGCPDGETPDQVGVRADRIVDQRSQFPRQRFVLFKRAFSSSVSGTLVGARCGRRHILHARYRKPENAWIRTQSVGTSNPAVERRPARRRSVGDAGPKRTGLKNCRAALAARRT
jgi:broad specificity phosphatase PhoE